MCKQSVESGKKNAFSFDKKITVLFPYVGDTLGGSHISSLLLVKELDKDPCLKVVVVLHEKGPLSSYLEKIDQPYIVSPDVDIVCPGKRINEMFGIVKSGLGLRSFLTEMKVDVVHTNDLRMHLTWLMASRLAGCKMVWHQRTATTNKKLGVYSKLASAVVTISQFCIEKLPPRMSKKAKLVNNPVSIHKVYKSSREFRGALLKEVGSSEGDFIICWVSNFVKNKRPNDFIRSAKYVSRKTNVQVKFLMFGEKKEPFYSEAVSLIKELGVDDIVIPMGMRVPIEPYIMESDLLIATSENEGLGRTLIEAMICKTPVIASNDGGHKEIVSDKVNGRLFPLGDFEELGEIILDYLENPGPYKEMAEISADAAIEKYSPESHAKNIIQIYRSL